MHPEEYEKKMGQLIAKCWTDEGFKQKLMADPTATLKALGEELPAGVSIKVVENTDKVFHLVIPAKPTELSEKELDRVVGGEMCVPAADDCYGAEGKERGGSYHYYCGSCIY
jgi:hypothetical protein